ncbi:hypothetical protein HFO63_07180 [Rhizobium laguerreae]|uniref:Uncharacterized protein n=1 Tax=Rhizobium laguerreae TaxID=1076926 RepID=A0AAJ3A6S9_9HYPH|nr:DUF6665 family protein [Rhizobium laguerreae]MBY3067763.1 hypothetical protein [Rhizobium laguerreae]MBY3081318.1 hypothetical protein [Rhizobium laguerreae]MBY3083090.1 hypothetical protein [Rhizobium laguerreae]MBY3115214.1 hypothetical protein [Rhizobium laguerreae]MBY3145378.1 hypothetical protein [Rhizobium laguerreae]
MSVRPPQSFRQSEQDRNGFNVLEYELMSERAESLGRHGLKVEAALAALRTWTAYHESGEDHERLLNEASDAVWAFFIQREICGLRNNRDAIQRYGIPNEVIARLGAIRK